MSAGGFIVMARKIYEHEEFDGEPFSRRDAFMWLVAQAVWADTATLKRGQLQTSLRTMAATFGWTLARTRWALKRFSTKNMVEIHSTDHSTGHSTPPTIITICNYDKYQSSKKPNNTGHSTGHSTLEKEENQLTRSKEGKKVKGADAPYAFEGGVVKLSQKHFDGWSKAFSNLDLLAELTARDAWLGSPRATDADRANWFVSTSTHFRNLNQRAKQISAPNSHYYAQAPRPGSKEDTRERTVNALRSLNPFPDADDARSGEGFSSPVSRLLPFSKPS